MTLTKTDLQQIRTVVHEAIQEETPKIVKQELTTAIDAQIRPVIREEIEIALKPVKKKLNKVARDVNTLIPYFDKRVTTLENEFRAIKQN